MNERIRKEIEELDARDRADGEVEPFQFVSDNALRFDGYEGEAGEDVYAEYLATEGAVEAAAPYAQAEAKKRKPRAVLRKLSDYPDEDVTWRWPGRIPDGMLTAVYGEGGKGKSFVTLDIAARITTGAD